MEEIVSRLSKNCAQGCSGLSHVLCIQDTTEVVFHHSGRLSHEDKDFGYGTSEYNEYSIFAHPSMVVDAVSLMPVGFSYMKVWSRDRAQDKTSHVVDTVKQAMECIEWYKCRWFIEELFRVCKSEGFRIESVQLESGAAVKKLTVLTMYAALRCMTLKRAYDEQDESVPANRMFDEQEMEMLEVEMEYIHRKSPKALDGRNPFHENSLPWAAWIIARLGGWSGYVKAHGRPGYITMKKGLDRFNQHLEIIAFAKAKFVYKE